MDNTSNRTDRSSFVTTLAWVFIVLCGFSTLIAIGQNVMIHTLFPVDQMETTMHASNAQQNIPAAAEFMMSHVQLFFGAFLVISAVTLISSVALLKRMNWARLIFIILMSLGILWNIGGLFFQQAMFSSMPSPPPTANSVEFQAQFDSIAQAMMIFSVIIALGFSILFGWIIKRLSSQEIKREFKAVP